MRFLAYIGVALIMAAAGSVAAGAAAGGAEFARTITLREPLGLPWTDELVHQDVTLPDGKAEAAKGRVALASLAVADAAGRAVPFQAEVLDGTPDAVRRFRLWLKVTLAPHAEAAFRLTWNNAGRVADPATRAMPPAANRVTVRREGERLVLSTGVLDVAAAAPAKPYAEPTDLRKAAAPILGVRPAGEKSWQGQWRLDGPARVREIKTAVEASGPLWGRIRVRYVFEKDGRACEVVLRAVAGEPWVDVSEKYRLGPAGRMTILLRDKQKPAEMLWAPWIADADGLAEAAWDVRRMPLAGAVAAAEEAEGGRGLPGDIPAKTDAGQAAAGAPDAPPLAVLSPRRSRQRGESPLALVVAGEGGGAVGAVMVHAGDWLRPYEQLVRVRALADATGLTMEFPMEDGQRRWALVAGLAGRFDSRAEVQALVRRHAEWPLDRVLSDDVFRWKREAGHAAPHVLTTWPQLQTLRADLAAGRDTASVRLLRAALEAEASADPSSAAAADRALAELLVGRGADAVPPVPDASPPTAGVSPPAAATSVPAVASAAAPPAVGLPDVAAIMGRAFADEAFRADTWPQPIARAVERLDLASAGRPAGDAATALLAYLVTNADFWPGRAAGWDVGRPEDERALAAVAINLAALMPDHPHAKRWMLRGLEPVRGDLRRMASAGESAASPADQAAALETLLPLARTAQNSGLDDPFRWPEWRAPLESLRNLHTPPDARLGRRCLTPCGGGPPWHDSVGPLFAVAAAGIRPADAKLAAAWMALAAQYDGAGRRGDLARDLLRADLSLAAGRLDDAAWPSRRLPGFGAVLRSRFGTVGEAFAAFKCGPAAAGDGGELAFHFYGAGSPVALEWAGGGRLWQENMHNRITLGDGENMDATGDLVALETSPAGDLAVGQLRTDRLRRLPPAPQEAAAGASYPRRRLAAEARVRRYLLLVKHAGGPLEDYLVIRDEVAAAEPAMFNLFVLARSVRQEGPLFHFDGQLATDALLFVATPMPDKTAFLRWGWPAPETAGVSSAGVWSPVVQAPDPLLFTRETAQGVRSPNDRAPDPGSATGVWNLGDVFGRTEGGPALPTLPQGEVQQGVRLTDAPGRPFLTVLYPLRKDGRAPQFRTLAGGKGVRVSLGDAADEIYLSTDPAPGVGGQAVIRQGDKTTVLLKAKALPNP